VSERLFKGAMRTAVISRQTVARLLRLRNENFTTKGAKDAREPLSLVIGDPWLITTKKPAVPQHSGVLILCYFIRSN